MIRQGVIEDFDMNSILCSKVSELPSTTWEDKIFVALRSNTMIETQEGFKPLLPNTKYTPYDKRKGSKRTFVIVNGKKYFISYRGK